MALAHYHERFVVPTAHRERTDEAPYIERGFAGFGEMAPGRGVGRRTGFHGGRQEVGS
jgi:nitrate reductase beta subunit